MLKMQFPYEYIFERRGIWILTTRRGYKILPTNVPGLFSQPVHLSDVDILIMNAITGSQLIRRITNYRPVMNKPNRRTVIDYSQPTF